MEIKWLIWSFEHSKWWMPNSRGYTEKLSDAGKYGFEDAWNICQRANEYGHINEAMLPEVKNVRQYRNAKMVEAARQ